MTPHEYAEKLRHCADVIERLGVVPISAGIEGDGSTFALLRMKDFQASVEICLVAEYQDRKGVRYYEAIIDGVGFVSNEVLPVGCKLPLKAGAV